MLLLHIVVVVSYVIVVAVGRYVMTAKILICHLEISNVQNVQENTSSVCQGGFY